jgi:hypothetical protein
MSYKPDRHKEGDEPFDNEAPLPSLRERCDIALRCLPDAEYRAMLSRLFDDLLAASGMNSVASVGAKEERNGVTRFPDPADGWTDATVSAGVAMAPKPSATDILGAVARGWTHGPNQRKKMDPDLAIAIAAEVSALINAVKGPEHG